MADVRAIRPDLGTRPDPARLNPRAPVGIVGAASPGFAPDRKFFLEGASGRTVTSTGIAAPTAPADSSIRHPVPVGVAVEWRSPTCPRFAARGDRDDPDALRVPKELE